MARNIAAPLLIIYASLLLALPIGGHDVLEGAPHPSSRPHLHLSMIDEMLGLEIACKSPAANSFAAATEHDNDVVYLPNEAGVTSFSKCMAAIEGLGLVWRASNQLGIASMRASSLAADAHRFHARVAVQFFMAIERWQI